MYTPFFLLAVLLSGLSVTVANVLQSRALPTPISGAAARTALSKLAIRADVTSPAYDRNRFKHWITISGKCDTRKTVLKRDGKGVAVDANCSPTAGTWYSPYDGVTETSSSALDVDHLVPLKEAWISGAHAWTDAQREGFANDLVRPQLVAVTARTNRSKGGRDPAQWIPPLASFVCEYARAWVQVKQYYGLSVDAAEHAALTSHLKGC